MYCVLPFMGREREYKCVHVCTCVYIGLYFLREVMLSENFLKMITYRGMKKR